MKYDEVKFLLKFDEYDPSAIGDVFNNSKCFLNWQFGENFKADIKEGDVDYQIMDVSDLNSADIEKITDSFFSFEFEDISNVSLYRFLVLKNNNKCTLLAIIHPLIFSYSSVNDFYELFNNINSNSLKNDLNLYYGDVKEYCNKDKVQFVVHDCGDFRKYNGPNNMYEPLCEGDNYKNCKYQATIEDWYKKYGKKANKNYPVEIYCTSDQAKMLDRFGDLPSLYGKDFFVILRPSLLKTSK